jgi:hypothetical protein
MPENGPARRDGLMTTLAILMALLALSNFSKPIAQAMDPGGNAGFVFFGHRLHGMANAVAGPLFGLILAAYAYGVWTRKRWVVPLAAAYAVYVIVNLVVFAIDPPPGPQSPLPFLILYALVAVGVSAGGALYLRRHRDRLAG